LAFHGLGINGKISELQAAMGLAVFPHMKEIISGRKKIVDYYRANLDFTKVKPIKIRENTDWNYSYFPVIFASEEKLLQVQKALNEQNIFPRRYFYPSLNTIPYVAGEEMPISESIASSIMCLPLYMDLAIDDADLICKIVNK